MLCSKLKYIKRSFTLKLNFKKYKIIIFGHDKLFKKRE